MKKEELFRKWETIVEDLETKSIGKTFESTDVFHFQDSHIETLITRTFTLNQAQTHHQNEDSSLPLKIPSNLLQYYTFQETIAEGGMGVISKGYQQSLDRQVAAKKLLSNLTAPRDRARFIAESKVTAYLDHPNIIPVYDLGTTENQDVVLIMKLISGKSWGEILKEKKKANTLSQRSEREKQLRILLNVCNALIYAHQKEIVHNDLKPDNVMIGEFGEIYLMDWGIAVNIGDPQKNLFFLHKSAIVHPMGTPCYIAPELACGNGQEIGPQTDVYLLGAVLYEILMQTPPQVFVTRIVFDSSDAFFSNS